MRKIVKVKIVDMERVSKYTDAHGNVKLPYPYNGYKVVSGKGNDVIVRYQITKRV